MAYSIIESVTALSSASRADANLATAAALTAIAEHGGPRCCKRETITTIQAFAHSTGFFAADSLAPYTCHQCGRMQECIGTRCPFTLPTRTESEVTPTMSQVLHINADEFESVVLQSQTPVILDFYSDECPPCEALAPIFNKMNEKYGEHIKFVKMHRQHNREFATSIRSPAARP